MDRKQNYGSQFLVKNPNMEKCLPEQAMGCYEVDHRLIGRTEILAPDFGHLI